MGGSFGPQAGWLTPEYIGGGNTIHEQSFSRLASAGPVHGWGWKSAVVGAVVPDGPRLDPTNWAEQTFAVKLTLTDRASGQAGTLTFAATGGENLIQDYDNPFSGFLLGRTCYAAITGDADQTITLGGREYHVGLGVRERADEAELVADVRVGPAPATPEPTTLALAGLGLGVVALRRRKHQVGSRGLQPA